MLKYSADIKTIIYMIITSALFAYQWVTGEVNAFIYTWYLFMSVSAAVMAHNHNHLPMWNSKIMNLLTDYWITIFYGFPIFSWIPTHNQNHHRYNNTEPDLTKTYRFTEKNNLFTVLTYPSMSGYFQQSAIGQYIKLKLKNDKKYFYNTIVMQIAILVIWTALFLILDWKKAIYFVILPQQFSLFSVLLFNYVQHIHADEMSDYNHSRNFVGALNFFLFNNGLHTIHHEKANIHWSEAPKYHAEIESEIDSSLKEKSFWWFLIRTYILGTFVPSLRTHSMRRDRLAKEPQAV